MGRDHQDAIMATRQSQVNTDDPIVTRERTAQANGDAVRSNLTKAGRDILGIDPGDALTVQVYTDRIEIRRKDDVERE
jgi:hypothetical protein